ncbi:MAG: BPL-N domain-containing protein, partial [Nitrospirota bacterium]
STPPLHPPLSKGGRMGGVAFLWDESFLWGLMAYKALKAYGLPFDLIKAEDIKAGALNGYKMLFVPGGWASNKIKALGEEGAAAIRKFVSDGGSYLGFCGGAGLATAGKDGLGLVNIKRRPTKERVPSFSGRIELNINEHPIWKDIPPHPPLTKGGHRGGGNSHPVFHAWWPSQFIVEDDSIKILATYGDALPDAFSSDICVGDVDSSGRWEELEAVYKINLNPARLRDEPAVIEGIYGKGKVVLSLVHFDTPEDVNGQRVLENLWEYFGCQNTELRIQNPDEIKSKGSPGSGLWTLCSELISLGERNFLWFWRNTMLLQWRRGVRGLEYNTLYIMIKEIVGRGVACNAPAIGRLQDSLVPFVDKAKKLLVLERHALQKGHITYERCEDPDIQKLRGELFSESKSHGGKFKELVDEIDNILFLHLTGQD